MSLSRLYNVFTRYKVTVAKNSVQSSNFEHVFSFPFVGYFALLNRLKVYHFFGSCAVIPSTGLLELTSVIPESTFYAALYIGITGGVVLSLASLPFKNVIGHIYISDDNNFIKISSIDFYGRRVDRIIKTEEWIPILDMEPRILDAFYLKPELTDGTKYKLLIKFGTVKNSRKMGEVLE
ncbi:uncharacterized protein LOC119832721 [Zerene cesonia]|uniref:uncharacterized protein LOC119832721 n=1 Tax=Zerene cesonia TaxID=33412 RepID=UPI0018E4F934|nr:uncharacterized protein LOC119832721 [Zerene cesonia]